jgi:hypothetical protein
LQIGYSAWNQKKEKFVVVSAGRQIMHIGCAVDLVAVAVCLHLVIIIYTMETGIEIALIFALGKAGRKCNNQLPAGKYLSCRARAQGTNGLRQTRVTYSAPLTSPPLWSAICSKFIKLPGPLLVF